MKIAYLIFVVLFFSACIYDTKKSNIEGGHDLTAKVIYLKDGDSFVVLDETKKEVEVRLLDIDAPELHQPFGKKAKTYLSNLIKGKTVGLDFEEKDKFGRILADVYWDNLFINEEMLKAGMAWHFTRFSNDKIFQGLENKARDSKKGLWQDAEPIAPWDWRDDIKK